MSHDNGYVWRDGTVHNVPEISLADLKCREVYDNRYHKTKADIGYDAWRIGFLAGYESARREYVPQRNTPCYE